MGTANALLRCHLLKTLSVVLFMIITLSAYSQEGVEVVAEHQGEPVPGLNLEIPEPVGVDDVRSNSYADEFWRQTDKAYEEEAKALANYAETYNETMDMVREELRKWQGDYAQGYNETMGMVQSELRKYRGPVDQSFGHLLPSGNRSLPGNRYGKGGIKDFKRPAEHDTILGPWELPEAPQPFDKFQQGLPPSF